MSHLEGIEKLRKDCADWGDHTNDEVQAVIDRAVSLGGKFVAGRIEAIYSKERGACICESDEEDCVDCRPYSISSEAASQALSRRDALHRKRVESLREAINAAYPFGVIVLTDGVKNKILSAFDSKRREWEG